MQSGSKGSQNFIEGTILESHKHQRRYKLKLRGVLYDFIADEKYQKLDLYVDELSPKQNQDIHILSFQRAEDLSKHKSCEKHAIIKRWVICEKDKRLRCEGTYHFCDPEVVQQ